ncbi:MFS transporter [Streptomyces sp. NPDC015127]|uniref:MFS transporter n=1 Tax=Streptomyces sp. NPDC015127 TaxID=3364939 RepID=UPI0036FD0701
MLDIPGFMPYLTARGLTMFGSTMAPVALAFAVLDAAESASFLGLVLAAQTAPQLVFLLVGGAVGDRASRKHILVVTNVVMAVCQGSTAALLVLGHVNLVLVMVLQAVWGTARAFFTPANTGVVPDLVPAERIQDATALVTLSRSIASIGGPAAAGGLLLVWNPGYIVLGDALLFLVSAVLIAKLPLSRPTAAPEESLRQSLVTGWREFAGRSWVWSMVSSFGFYQGLVRPAIFVVGPVMAAEEGGMGAVSWGMVLAVQGVGSVVGGLLLFWWRPARPLLVSTLLVGLDSLFLLALATTSRLEPVAVVALLGATGVTMADALWLSTLQREIPSDALSRVSSYEWLGSLALNPLGMAVTGMLVAVVGPEAILVAVALANFAVRGAVLLVPGVRRIRNVPPGGAEQRTQDKAPASDAPGTTSKV